MLKSADGAAGKVFRGKSIIFLNERKHVFAHELWPKEKIIAKGIDNGVVVKFEDYREIIRGLHKSNVCIFSNFAALLQ